MSNIIRGTLLLYCFSCFLEVGSGIVRFFFGQDLAGGVSDRYFAGLI